ncbi:MAG: exosortase system-associated protein, TIGR04073 family [Candidatus Omnitrophica bacterium]|nr:exosortase system-associated protein, TIGR04073 family [Candidatus Omnitrophota bacterium]
MKKIFCVFAGLILIFTFTSICSAEETESGTDNQQYVYNTDEVNFDKTPANKLGRGVINTATCWAEVPAEVMKMSKEKDPVVGCTLGLAVGIFNGLVRGVTGLYDAVTFVAPPYDKPIMKPEYSLKNADDKMREYLW